ncbi:YgaP family membrane protein [Amaricoccus macauensis]|uniref:YgaP family membrane protein n=1 Tax=Amaricoccus macauensis TaxID=57001 RepID=UPI003C7A30B6
MGASMKTNVGTIDRLVRAMLGLVLLYLAFSVGFLSSVHRWSWSSRPPSVS